MPDRATAFATTHPMDTFLTNSGFDAFGPPPLLEGEKVADYDTLLRRIFAAVDPIDFAERIWVRDIADLTWEILRLRRFKIFLIESAEELSLNKVLAPIETQPRDRYKLINDYVAQDPDSIKVVEDMLDILKRSKLYVHALSYASYQSRLAEIERLLTQMEGRRNMAFREIDRRRETKLRLKTQLCEIEDQALAKRQTDVESPA